MKQIVILIFIIIIPLMFMCNNTNSLENELPKDLIKSFFQDYENDIDLAVSNLFATNSWVEDDNESIKDLKEQLNQTTKVLGDYEGFELIVIRNAGKSNALKVYSYIVKYDRQPLRFNFVFYKFKNQWRIHGFQFDADFDTELEESTRLFFLDNSFSNDLYEKNY